MIKYLPRGMFPVWIGFISTEKEYKKEMNRLGLGTEYNFMATDHSDATLHSGIDNSGRYILALCISEDKINVRTPIECAGLMAHEATHAWQRVRDYIGEEKTLETEAYFIQYVTQFFLECVESSINKKIKFSK